MAGTGKPLTQDEKLVILASDNLTATAKALNRNPATVYGWMRSNGHPLPKERNGAPIDGTKPLENPKLSPKERGIQAAKTRKDRARRKMISERMKASWARRRAKAAGAMALVLDPSEGKLSAPGELSVSNVHKNAASIAAKARWAKTKQLDHYDPQAPEEPSEAPMTHLTIKSTERIEVTFIDSATRGSVIIGPDGIQVRVANGRRSSLGRVVDWGLLGALSQRT